MEKEGVKRMGRKAGFCPFRLQGTAWKKSCRKGKEARDRGRSCLLVPSYWTSWRKKNSRGKGKGVKRKRRKARLCPFY